MSIIKVTFMYFFRVINYLILIRVILSWVARGRSNTFIQLIYGITEPILQPFRELQHKLGIGGMLDFSPIMALLTLQLIQSIIIGL